MGCYVRLQNNLAEIWVSNNTTEDAVQSCVSTYHDRGYHIVIYRSGNHYLADMTIDLLSNNIV